MTGRIGLAGTLWRTALGAAASVAGALPSAADTAAPNPAATPPPAQAEPAVLYLMDQIVTGPLPQEVLQQMQPLHKLDEVEAVLKAHKIAFAWREAEIASTQIEPGVARQINALPPHEVFVAPQGQGWIISVVLNTRPAPPQASPPQPT